MGKLLIKGVLMNIDYSYINNLLLRWYDANFTIPKEFFFLLLYDFGVEGDITCIRSNVFSLGAKLTESGVMYQFSYNEYKIVDVTMQGLIKKNFYFNKKQWEIMLILAKYVTPGSWITFSSVDEVPEFIRICFEDGRKVTLYHKSYGWRSNYSSWKQIDYSEIEKSSNN